MAIRIPTPEAAGLGGIQRASGQRGGIGARREADTFSGEQMSQIGRAGLQLASELQSRRDETSLLEAQQLWNTKRREWLDPETGLFAQRNGDAMGITDAVDQAAKEYAEELQGNFTGLSNDGRQALTQLLDNERQRLYERAATHELGQSYQYEQALLEAQMDSERDRAIAAIGTPGEETEWSASLQRADTAARSWLQLQGIDPESDDPNEAMLAETMLKGKRTEHLLALADAVALSDPLAAEELVDSSEEALDGTAVTQWRRQNETRIETAQAQRDVGTAVSIDRAVYEGAAPVNHSTEVSISLGPQRPEQPNQRIVDVVAIAAQDVLGPGARVEVFSGKDDSPTDGPNASPSHYSGDAVDVRFYRPDGSQVMISDPEFEQLALAAANRGALGIGFGLTYKGAPYMGSAMHVDMFEKRGSGGFGHFWGDGAAAIGDELMAAMEAAEGISQTQYSSGWEYIMAIEDDGVREKAIQRYSQQAKFQRDQMQIAAEQTANDLVNQAIEIKNKGGNVDVQGLIEGAQGNLGPLTGATYERLLAVAEGRMIQGDTNLFNELWENLNSQPEKWMGDAPVDITATFGHQLNTEQIAALEARRRAIGDRMREPNVGRDERGINDIPLWSESELDNIILSATFSDKDLKDKNRDYYSRLAYEALDSYQRAQISAGGGRPSIDEMERMAERFINAKMAVPSAIQWFTDADDPRMKTVELRDRAEFYERKGMDFLLGEEALTFQTPSGGEVTAGNADIRAAYLDWKDVYGLEPDTMDVLMLLQFRADRARPRQ